MSPVVSSLIAVFLVLALGWLLRIFKVVDDGAWAGFERVTYFVFFPAVSIQTLALADLGTLPVGRVGAALVGAILIVTGALLVLRPALARRGVDGPAFTSIFQGAARWNSFVALAIAGNLLGQTGVTLMAIAIAAMVPLLNLLSVTMLTRFANAAPVAPARLVRAILANPFIWACAVGLVLNPVSGYAPAPLLSALDILARATLAGGLLVVGAGLDIRRLARPRIAHWLSTALKLVAMPTLAWLIASRLGVSGAPLQLVVIVASVPTAAASYILARQMGGDAPLMAEITTLQTLLALVTIPVALIVLS